MSQPETQRQIVVDSRAWTGDLEADYKLELAAQRARDAAHARWAQAHPVLNWLILFTFGAALIVAAYHAPDREFGGPYVGCLMRRGIMLSGILVCGALIVAALLQLIRWPVLNRRQGWRVITETYAPSQSQKQPDATKPSDGNGDGSPA